jgi:peroxiredoxin Q/BCP
MAHTLIGTKAPPLQLVNYNGDSYDFLPGQGVPVALCFYPKSGSYSCTRQACQLRDALSDEKHFKNTKLQIIGISSDSVEKQARFVEKQKLTFPVLSDPEGEARTAYKVGKTWLGLLNSRVTFLIDADGIVQRVLDTTINYGAHIKFVSKWLDTIHTDKPASIENDQKANPRQFGSIAAVTFVEDDEEREPSLERVSTLPPQL